MKMLPLAKIRNESALDKKIPKKMHRDKSIVSVCVERCMVITSESKYIQKNYATFVYSANFPLSKKLAKSSNICG